MSEKRIVGKIRLIYSDTTPAAFLAGLRDNSRSAGLCEDEAGRIFEGRLINDLGLLNKLWDGRDVTVDRKHESFRIRAPRCTVSWMVQPAVFGKFMERKGEEARGIGFMARCLVSYPLSTQGSRFLKCWPRDLDAVQKFRERILELLTDQIDLLRPEPKEVDRG